MATDVNILDMTYRAFGDLRSNQFHAVEFQAAKVVQLCSAVTAIACGIIQNNPNSGDVAVVRHLGVTKYKSWSGAYANHLGTTAVGTLKVVTPGTDTTHYVIGQGLESTVSGDIGSMKILGTPVRAT